MEEKRACQSPDTAIATSDDKTAQRTAPSTQDAPADKEDAVLLAAGNARVKKDRAEMDDAGFGDHKGTKGF